MTTDFWNDLESKMADAEFAREYASESIRIATIDAVVNAFNEAAETEGLTKAGLARAAGMNPAVVRRLLSASSVNPTLSTVTEVAAALGLRVTLQPMSPEERASITEPMRRSAAA
jgi:DNA-binding phage protein